MVKYKNTRVYLQLYISSEPYVISNVRVVNNGLGFILFSFSFIFIYFILSFFFFFLFGHRKRRKNVTSHVAVTVTWVTHSCDMME